MDVFLETERRGHESFASTRRRIYVEQPAQLVALDDFVRTETSGRGLLI
jgi:hypothetical protein